MAQISSNLYSISSLNAGLAANLHPVGILTSWGFQQIHILSVWLNLAAFLSTHGKYTPIRYLEFFISQSKLVKKGRGIWMSNLKLMVLKPRDVLNPGKDAVSQSGKVHANSTNDKSLCGLNLTHELLRGWKLPYNFLPLPLKLKKQDFNCTLCLFQHFWNCHQQFLVSFIINIHKYKQCPKQQANSLNNWEMLPCSTFLKKVFTQNFITWTKFFKKSLKRTV